MVGGRGDEGVKGRGCEGRVNDLLLTLRDRNTEAHPLRRPK